MIQGTAAAAAKAAAEAAAREEQIKTTAAAQAAAKAAEIEQLKADIAKLSAETKAAKAETAQANKEKEAAVAEKEAADQARDVAEQAKADAERAKADAERAKADAERKQTEAEKARDEAKADAEQAKADAIKAAGAEAAAQAAVAKAATQAATQAAEIEGMKAEIDQLKTATAAAQAEATQATAEKDAAIKERNEAQQARNAADQARDVAVRKEKEAEEARDAAKQARAAAEQARAAAEQATAVADTARAAAEQDKEKAEQTNRANAANYIAKIAELHEDHTEKTTRLQTMLQTAEDTIQAQLRALQQDMLPAGIESETFESIRNALKKQKQEQESRIQILETEIQTAREALTAQQRDHEARLKQQKQELTAQYNQASQDRIRQMEDKRKVDLQQAQNLAQQTLKATEEAAQQKKSELQSQIHTLESQVQILTDGLRQAQSQLTEQESQNKAAEAEAAAAQATLVQLQDALVQFGKASRAAADDPGSDPDQDRATYTNDDKMRQGVTLVKQMLESIEKLKEENIKLAQDLSQAEEEMDRKKREHDVAIARADSDAAKTKAEAAATQATLVKLQDALVQFGKASWGGGESGDDADLERAMYTRENMIRIGVDKVKDLWLKQQEFRELEEKSRELHEIKTKLFLWTSSSTVDKTDPALVIDGLLKESKMLRDIRYAMEFRDSTTNLVDVVRQSAEERKKLRDENTRLSEDIRQLQRAGHTERQINRALKQEVNDLKEGIVRMYEISEGEYRDALGVSTDDVGEDFIQRTKESIKKLRKNYDLESFEDEYIEKLTTTIQDNLEKMGKTEEFDLRDMKDLLKCLPLNLWAIETEGAITESTRSNPRSDRLLERARAIALEYVESHANKRTRAFMNRFFTIDPYKMEPENWQEMIQEYVDNGGDISNVDFFSVSGNTYYFAPYFHGEELRIHMTYPLQEALKKFKETHSAPRAPVAAPAAVSAPAPRVLTEEEIKQQQLQAGNVYILIRMWMKINDTQKTLLTSIAPPVDAQAILQVGRNLFESNKFYLALSTPSIQKDLIAKLQEVLKDPSSARMEPFDTKTIPGYKTDLKAPNQLDTIRKSVKFDIYTEIHGKTVRKVAGGGGTYSLNPAERQAKEIAETIVEWTKFRRSTGGRALGRRLNILDEEDSDWVEHS